MLVIAPEQRERLIWNQQPIRKKDRWLRVYALLAVRFEERTEGEGWVDVNEICNLLGWDHLSPREVGKELNKECKRRDFDGCSLIVAAPHAKTSLFSLDIAVVARPVVFHPNLDEVRDWLGVGYARLEKVSERSLNWAAAVKWLAEGQTALEHGHLDKARDSLVQLRIREELWSPLFPADRAQALITLIWVSERLGRLSEAEKYVDDLLELIEVGLDRRSTAQAHIQIARWHLSVDDVVEAEDRFFMARRFTREQDHFELGRIEAGRSEIAGAHGDLDSCRAHALAAVDHFIRARWWYGVQAAYALVANERFARYERLEPGDPKGELLLQETDVWMTRCLEMANLSGIGSISMDGELFTARVARLRGDHAKCRGLLRVASRGIRKSGLERERGLALLEWAEFAFTLGRTHAAKRLFWQAHRLAARVKDTVNADQAFMRAKQVTRILTLSGQQ